MGGLTGSEVRLRVKGSYLARGPVSYTHTPPLVPHKSSYFPLISRSSSAPSGGRPRPRMKTHRLSLAGG